mgnify:CR=1 FL=1
MGVKKMVRDGVRGAVGSERAGGGSEFEIILLVRGVSWRSVAAEIEAGRSEKCCGC